MYEIGALIIYGNEGVCRVDEIGVPESPGADKDRLYYTLTPLYRNGRVITPVDTTVFSRPVISGKDAEDIIAAIPSVEAEAYNDRNLKNLTEHYKSEIQSYDCIDIVRTIKSIRLKRTLAVKNGKKLGTIDERFLRRAEEMLYGELSAAMKLSFEDIRSIVLEKLTSAEA